MFDDLKGQVGVVTGGARGLGFSMASALARHGVDIALIDILDYVRDSAESLAGFGVRSLGLLADVTSETSLEAAFGEVEQRLGPPTVLINAAGITVWEDSLEGTKATWSRVIDVNLTGTYLSCQMFGRACKRTGHGGAIVNVSSMSSTVVNIPQHQVSYHASKAGVDMVTKALAVEWAPLGIRVNAIAPGYFLSDMTRQFIDVNRDLATKWSEMIPVGRMGEPADLDGLVVLLCSSSSSYLTGQSVVIDGGYTCI
ncbi:MAG TPA: SDR family oxidoreductase [Acidimicrobiales bacterium]|nr:SDR family oxidoreductase [Acidimicrobiales bacterium]